MRLQAALLGIFLSAGCASQPKKAETTPPAKMAAPESPAPATAESNDRGDSSPAAGPFMPIYFETDRAEISDDAKRTLESVADHLKTHRVSTVTIAGHTDDRGTEAYNLALGDRRAEVTRQHLIRLGVDRSKLKTVSFGETRPAAEGTGESAWSRNRRAEFERR